MFNSKIGSVMAYDLEEQEQLDEIKAWWKTNGSKITYGLLAIVIAYAGFQGYGYYQKNQSLKASAEYQALLVSKNNFQDLQVKAANLMDHFAGTPYAGRAALFVAKANYGKEDLKTSKAQLTWAAKNAKETGVQAIASLQLASILLEEKAFDASLKALETNYDSGFEGLRADLKGDVLVALGKVEEAKFAYEEALVKLDTAGKYRALTQQKRAALG